ncbi:hypothetical protein [Allosphingosinicella vermicomposti]|uniref:hypothetical protein n=1 Tax=Allosphingosinicella vermicomposti TaxID=614671 RepID=UPI000D0EE82C|nr:hypothetical protein [Allosphingosinicella vermicomposti]
MRRAAMTLAALVLLTACGRGEDENMPTAEESQGLNEAAEMLDTSPDSLVATDDAELGNGEIAADANELDANEALTNEE